MSHYAYIKDWLIHYISDTKDTVEDQSDAFQSLLKSELRECDHCVGTGKVYYEDQKAYHQSLFDCFCCRGSGVLCSWCGQIEPRCECGGEE